MAVLLAALTDATGKKIVKRSGGYGGGGGGGGKWWYIYTGQHTSEGTQ